MTMDETVKALGDATAGLLFPSETDAPFTPFSWPVVSTVDAETVEAVTWPKGAKKKRAVTEQTVAAFFAELEDADDAAGFNRLKAVVGKVMTNPKVFRVGGPEVEVYLVGLAANGEVADFRTVSVET
jgi:hypothetical protein